MRVSVFDEKTGQPWWDNRARRSNRALRRTTRGAMRVHARSRRRRKQLMGLEYPRYVELVAAVASDMARRESAA